MPSAEKVQVVGWICDDLGYRFFGIEKTAVYSAKTVFLALFLFLVFRNAQAQNSGDPDLEFGDAGRVVENLSQSFEIAYGVAVQPDGKIITTGDLWTGLNDYAFVVRHTADGKIDSSFATNGFARLGSDTTDLLPNGGVALQTDGKILVAGLFVDVDGLKGFVLRLLPNGVPDPGFGNNGLVLIDIGSNSRLYAVTVAPGGKILAAGGVSTGMGLNSAVIRLLNDGSLDPGFGIGGLAEVATTAIGTDLFYSLAVLPNGDILATGYSSNNGAGTAVRFDANGFPVVGFGDNGTVLIEEPNGTTIFYSAAAQTDGKILLGGYRNVFPDRDFLVMRLLSNGDTDPNFGSGGSVLTNVGNADVLRALTVQPDGKILGAGYQITAEGFSQALLLRYTAAGNLDAAFGNNGIITNFSDTAMSRFYALTLRPNNSILAAGYRLNSRNGFDLALAGFQHDGSAENTFGTGNDGWAAYNLAKADNQQDGLSLGDNGQIFLVSGSPVGDEFNVLRYSSGGVRQSLDSLRALPGENVVIQTVAQIPGGGFLVVGRVIVDTCVIWRFKSDGAMDGTLRFGLPGMTSITFRDAAVQTDEKILLCGYGVNTNGEFVNLIARLLPDGSMDTGWNNTGILELPSDISAEGWVLRVQPDGKVLVGGGSASGTDELFLARYNVNGTADSGFGNNGIQLQELGGPDETARDILIDPSGRIVVAGLVTSSVGVLQNIVLRFSPSGFLESGFGAGGAVLLPIGSNINNYHSINFIFRLGLQADGKILLSGYANANMALFRMLPDGSPDGDFGVNGVVTTDIFGETDIPGQLLIQPDGKILQSGMAYNGADYDAVLLRYLPGMVIGTEDLAPDGNHWLIYPNPVREYATLRYQNPAAGNVTVLLETVEGQVLQTFFNAFQPVGEHTCELRLDARLPSGTYICRVLTPGGQAAIRFIRL